MKSLRKERARKFASKWVNNGFNTTQAVIDCGITTNRNSAHVIGYRLLRNVTTIRAVEAHLRKTAMNADDVLARLTEIAQKNDVKFTGADVVKANELIGKGLKMFTDRVESIDVNEVESRKAFLLEELHRLRALHSDDNDYANEFRRLQKLMGNKTDPTYKADFDPADPQSLWREVPAELLPAESATEAVN